MGIRTGDLGEGIHAPPAFQRRGHKGALNLPRKDSAASRHGCVCVYTYTYSYAASGTGMKYLVHVHVLSCRFASR